MLRIALESGFATHETFTRAFVRRFGISPSEFRAVLREYRKCVEDAMGGRAFAGFTEETPLTLRFDLFKDPVTVEQTPLRHLLFVRHNGYEELLADGKPFLDLWDELFAYAEAQGVEYSPELLVGITHDDPDDRSLQDPVRRRAGERADADGPPVSYRYLPPGLCVARRHRGGLEEIAKTFAYIGVAWLPSGDYSLRAAAPFEVYHCARTSDGRT